MGNGWGGKREAGPGKKIGRPGGSKNTPRVYVVSSRGGAICEVIRLKVPASGFERAAETITIGRGRPYRSARLNSLEARALDRQLQEGLESGEAFVSPKTNWGGKREAGPGKKIGRPMGSTKLLEMASALGEVVPKSPLKSAP